MGISPNGGMTGADIVVGWVKDEISAVTVRNVREANYVGEIDGLIENYRM